MNISNIMVKLADPKDKPLLGYASVCLDESFRVHDFKIIESRSGLFVAMPSRKITDRCPHCRGKNVLRAAYCNTCGGRLNADRAQRDETGRQILYEDTMHPVTESFRNRVEEAILDAYEDIISDKEIAMKNY